MFGLLRKIKYRAAESAFCKVQVLRHKLTTKYLSPSFFHRYMMEGAITQKHSNVIIFSPTLRPVIERWVCTAVIRLKLRKQMNTGTPDVSSLAPRTPSGHRSQRRCDRSKTFIFLNSHDDSLRPDRLIIGGFIDCKTWLWDSLSCYFEKLVRPHGQKHPQQTRERNLIDFSWRSWRDSDPTKTSW